MGYSAPLRYSHVVVHSLILFVVTWVALSQVIWEFCRALRFDHTYSVSWQLSNCRKVQYNSINSSMKF